MKVTKVIVFQD